MRTLKKENAQLFSAFGHGFHKVEDVLAFRVQQQKRIQSQESEIQEHRKDVAVLNDKISTVTHEKDIIILGLEKQLEAASATLKVKLGAMDREIASSRDIAAAEYSVRESKLRQEMELAKTQHDSAVQMLKAQIAASKEKCEVAARNVIDIKEANAEKYRRLQNKFEDLQTHKAEIQRELNLASRDVAQKEFKIEKLSIEVEELREKEKRQIQNLRALERNTKESTLDLERESERNRREVHYF